MAFTNKLYRWCAVFLPTCGSLKVSYNVYQSDCTDMGITDPEQLLQWLLPFFFGHMFTLSLVSLTNNPKLTEVVKNSGQDGSQMKSSSSVASPATRVLFVFIIMTGPLKSAVSFACFFSLLHSSLIQFDVRVSLWDRAIWSSEFLKVKVFFFCTVQIMIDKY